MLRKDRTTQQSTDVGDGSSSGGGSGGNFLLCGCALEMDYVEEEDGHNYGGGTDIDVMNANIGNILTTRRTLRSLAWR